MLKNIILKSVVSLAMVTAMWSCRGGNEWTVDGRIEGAEGSLMIVEASDNGRWYPIDSVRIDSAGKFKITHEASGYPDIYRLRLGDKTLYFPIDSIETVTVVSRADAFDSDYTLAGTPQAEMLMSVDKKLLSVVNTNGVSAIATDTLLKRELGGLLLGDPSGIVSYYIINKRIGGISIFDPSNRNDLRVIGAVANAFNQSRPTDPRTAYLRNLYLSNRTAVRDSSAPVDTVFAREVGVFDIQLHDDKGVLQSLEKVMAKGNVVVLNFTLYSAEKSPEFNRELNKIYEKYHANGLEIFQVAVDTDEYQWRQAAANLPWITVLNPSSGTRNLLNYNVTDLPTSFVINRRGELIKRVDDVNELDSAVAAAM